MEDFGKDFVWIGSTYEQKGKYRILMLQDTITGQYSLAMGETKFRGELFSVVGGWEKFEGSFTKHGDDIIWFDLGLDMDGNYMNYEKGVDVQLVYPRGRKIKGSVEPIPLTGDCRRNNWKESSGGKLDGTVMESRGNAEEIFPLEIHAALSVNSHGKENPALPIEYEPDWDFLARAVLAQESMECPWSGKDISWANDALSEYRAFLQLLIEHKDWKSVKFVPSKKVDEVWSAHISFIDRYQRDMLYLTGGLAVIEHEPISEYDRFDKYQEAYNTHKERMLKKGRDVNSEFWPTPQYQNTWIPPF